MHAIVLAGDRGPDDPLVARFDAGGCKAMLPVAGIAMLERVLTTLQRSKVIQRVAIAGPPQQQLASSVNISGLLRQGIIEWFPPQPTPSRSAYLAIEKLTTTSPVLVTTADHPLLTVEIVEEFCTASLARDADVCVGLAPYELVRNTVPDMHKTVLRFSDGEYCGCNLFAFMTPKSHGALQQWQQVEQQRKSPLRLVRLLGWRALAGYALGQLTLAGALAGLSKRLGMRVSAVLLQHAHAAIDVDSINDYEIVQRLLTGHTMA